MTIDTQEALRLLDEMDCAASWSDQQRFYEAASAQLRALLSAKEGEPSGAQWWLAAIDVYGNARLCDGAHGERDGAERAFTLFVRLGLEKGRKLAIAEVRLTSPTGQHTPVDDDAIDAINSNRHIAIALRDAEKEKGNE